MSILKGKGEKIIESSIKTIGLLSVLPVVLILGYIICTGVPSISWEFLTQVPKDGMRDGGVLPAIIGSIYLTLGTIIVSVPFGILTGIILSISKAAGETAPIMFTVAAFYLPFLPENIWDQAMTLPYHLYVISTQVPNMPKANMDGTLFVLVAITVGFNLLGAYVRTKFNKQR